jgi:hypothetical protein
MKSCLKALLIGMVLAGSSSHTFAGGSIDLVDIKPLLDQQPKLWHFYLDRFDISPHGGGLRLGSEGIPLRGYRVPPYEFPARMKGDQGAYDLKITIIADIYFFDGQGKETSDETKAVSKKEVLTGISIGPLQEPTLKSAYSPK